MCACVSSDVNDNVPFFLSPTYEATVPEGADIGTSVIQVSAVDLDSDLHGTVRISSMILEKQRAVFLYKLVARSLFAHHM